nr:unnamed protein product [Spirometra erinaceieuropaei]
MGLPEQLSVAPEVKINDDLWIQITSKDLVTGTFDYRNSYTYKKFIEALHLPKAEADSNELIEAAEDDELAKALDHHSIVTSQLPDTQDDHVQTADEIIEELDRMMVDDALEPDLDLDFVGSQTCDDQAFSYIWKPVEVLNQLSIPQLNHLVDEIDSCIRYYSACLVHELATREELDYEQELKDIFFTLLLEVHSRIEGSDTRSRSVSPEIKADTKEAGGDSKKTSFLSGNSASAKATLANAALAVRLRWRRMGRSIETARSSSLSAAGGRLMRRTSSALNYLRRLTQPIRSQDVAGAAQRITTSNSTIDLPCLFEYQDSEWADMQSTAHRDGESLSASATPTSTLSPRRLPWYESSGSSIASSMKKRRAKRGPSREEDLKFLSTRIPFHLSATGDGPTVGHLELFNDFLRCMLTNNPNLTPLLTDYILNVYAPGDKSTPKLII